MKYILKVWNFFFPPPTPTYGWNIFRQKSWLEKQVNEEIIKRRERDY
jgi:hypothetical protein